MTWPKSWTGGLPSLCYPSLAYNPVWQPQRLTAQISLKKITCQPVVRSAISQQPPAANTFRLWFGCQGPHCFWGVPDNAGVVGLDTSAHYRAPLINSLFWGAPHEVVIDSVRSSLQSEALSAHSCLLHTFFNHRSKQNRTKQKINFTSTSISATASQGMHWHTLCVFKYHVKDNLELFLHGKKV